MVDYQQILSTKFVYMNMAGNTNHCRSLTKLQALVRGYLVRKKFSQLQLEYNEIVESIDGINATVTWRNDSILCSPTVVDRRLNTGEKPRVFSDNPGSPDTHESSSKSNLKDLNVLDMKSSIQTTLGLNANTSCKLNGNICKKSNTTTSNSCLTNNDLDSSQNSANSDRIECDNTMNTKRTESGSTNMKEANVPKQAAVGEQMAYPKDKLSLIKLREDLTMELLWLEQAIDSRVYYLKMKKDMSQTQTS